MGPLDASTTAVATCRSRRTQPFVQSIPTAHPVAWIDRIGWAEQELAQGIGMDIVGCFGSILLQAMALSPECFGKSLAHPDTAALIQQQLADCRRQHGPKRQVRCNKLHGERVLSGKPIFWHCYKTGMYSPIQAGSLSLGFCWVLFQGGRQIQVAIYPASPTRSCKIFYRVTIQRPLFVCKNYHGNLRVHSCHTCQETASLSLHASEKETLISWLKFPYPT